MMSQHLWITELRYDVLRECGTSIIDEHRHASNPGGGSESFGRRSRLPPRNFMEYRLLYQFVEERPTN